MAVITYQELQGVRDAMAKLDDGTREKVVEVIERVGTSDVDALREAIMVELAPVFEAADNIAAQIASAVFNHWRTAALGLPMETEEFISYEVGKMLAVANTAASKAVDGAVVDDIVDLLMTRASTDIRRSYGQTIIGNSRRDVARPRFARIPGPSASYALGCPFCRMLAGREFVYWSRKKAGEFDHYHPDCTCQVVSSWDENPVVEGYDPDLFMDEYLAQRDYAKQMKREHGDRTAVTASDISRAARQMGLDGRQE